MHCFDFLKVHKTNTCFHQFTKFLSLYFRVISCLSSVSHFFYKTEFEKLLETASIDLKIKMKNVHKFKCFLTTQTFSFHFETISLICNCLTLHFPSQYSVLSRLTKERKLLYSVSKQNNEEVKIHDTIG